MSGDESDPVTRQTNLDWDRKVDARLDALNATIERGLADSSRLASSAATLKDCLREHAEARIYDDWFALLDRIAACVRASAGSPLTKDCWRPACGG